MQLPIIDCDLYTHLIMVRQSLSKDKKNLIMSIFGSSSMIEQLPI